MKIVCNRGTCQLTSNEEFSVRLVDCDEYCSTEEWSGPIADFLVLVETPRKGLVVVEMTTGSKSATHVRDQIQGGVSMAELVLNENFGNTLFPLFLHRGGIKSIEYRIFKSDKCRIEYKGKKYRIIVARCGIILEDLIKKFS